MLSHLVLFQRKAKGTFGSILGRGLSEFGFCLISMTSARMSDNQTFPILNVITENLRLSHGHQSSSVVLPRRAGGGEGGRGSDVHSEAGKGLRHTRIINTRGTSVGVENNIVRLLHRGTSVSSDSVGCIHRDTAAVGVEHDTRHHYCAKHRNSFHAETSNGLLAKNSDSKSLCEFSSVNGSATKPVTDSDRLKVRLEKCGESQLAGPRAAVEIRPFQADRPLSNRTVYRDGFGVGHCRCRYGAQDALCGPATRGGRINSFPPDIPKIRSRLLHAEQLSKTSCDPNSKVENSLCRKEELQSHNPLHGGASESNFKSTGLNPAKAELCFGNGKLQDMMTCWWRYAPIARVLPAWQPLEGQLFKYTNVMKGWQYRWFVLNPDLGKLEYFEKEDHKKFSRPRGCLTLIGAVVCPSDEDSQTFTVNAANGESYRLKAYDARERQHWVNRLRATAEYHAESLLNSSGFSKNGHVTSSTSQTSSSPPMTSRLVENAVQARPTRTQMRTSPKPLTPKSRVPEVTTQTLTSSLRECRDQLESVRNDHQSVIAAIESLPSSGNFINTLDKDLLLFKATSTAAQSCLDRCLEILQHQASGSNGKDLGLEPLRSRSSDVLPSSSSCQLLDCSDSSLASKNSPLHPCYSNPLPENSVTNIDDDAILNHSDEVEDPQPYVDTELSGMEEHKNIILHLLSQLKLGMDLTKVVLPTFILEKRSLLEMFADCMAHPDLFLLIPDMPTPESRILSVVEWYLTSFHSGRQGSIAKKPYNPIIGESFHCSWITDEVAVNDISQLSKDQKSSVPAGQAVSAPSEGNVSQSVSSQNISHRSELYYCAEQVSHHPPVSAFYFESPEKQLYMEASVWTRSKFMGMSIGVAMIGKVRLHLPSYGEEYEFSLPSAYARSILTVPWVELGDKVTLTCEKTGFSAAVVFHTKPFYGGRLHKVTAEVKNPTGEPICKVSGEWNGLLEFNYANGHSKIVDTSQLPIMRKRVRPLELQGKMESRKLWRNVTESLEKGDVSRATEHKQQLEEIQRQGERRRRESRVPFPTKYFSRVGDEWMFKKRLRAEQKDASV